MYKNYLISQFSDNEYLLESFDQSFELNNFLPPKLQLQTIIEHAMSMEDMYDNLYQALDDFNRTLNNDNTALCPFHNFARL